MIADSLIVFWVGLGFGVFGFFMTQLATKLNNINGNIDRLIKSIERRDR